MAHPYMVSYDIKKDHENEYAPLTSYLESINGERILWSQWLVFHDGPAHDLAEILRGKIKTGDRLLVQLMTSDTAAVNPIMNQQKLALAIEVIRSGGR